MATVETAASGSGNLWTPDSLPMGTNVMAWGQAAARHILPITPYKDGYPDRTTINSILQTVGYKQPKVIDVVGGLLETIHRGPFSEEPNIRRYRLSNIDTGMEAQLRGWPGIIILTTTPHVRTNKEMEVGRGVDEPAVAEYSSLFSPDKPPYRFKMVIFDPGPKSPEGPEGEDSTYNLDVLAKASQADRRLPFFGMKPQNWGLKGVAARWAIMFQAVPDGENDVWVRLNYSDGTQSNELYRFIQREPGKAHVAVRAVNVSPTGF